MKPDHPNIVEFEVSGDYALFSNPVTRVGGEKSSYPVPTYEALKGVLHSIYWKPTFIWIVDQVRVVNRIQMEVKGVRPLVYTGRGAKQGDLAYYTYLRDCRYQVRAHFEWNENRPELADDRDENKHHCIARRMIERGGRRDVYLGTRECQAYVEPCAFHDGPGAYDEGKPPRIDMGLMVHGITYPDEAYSEETRGMMTLRMWKPVMELGVITFPRPEACPIVRPIRPMAMKPFGRAQGSFSGLGEFGEVN